MSVCRSVEPGFMRQRESLMLEVRTYFGTVGPALI